MESITFPGLKREKVLNTHKINLIPSGNFVGKTVKEALSYFSTANMSALILGSNDHKWLFSLTPQEALSQFFELLRNLYNKTNFRVVFVSTIFPRIEFYDSLGILKPGIKEFNTALLAADSKFIKIINKQGVSVNLTFRVVDMTAIFKYAEMSNPRFYCNRSKDGIHLKGVHAERYLEQMNVTAKTYIKSQQRKLILERKKKEKATVT